MPEPTEHRGDKFGFPAGRILFVEPTQDTSQVTPPGEIAGIMVQGTNVTHVVFYPGFDDNFTSYPSIPTSHGALYLYPISEISPDAPEVPAKALLQAIHEQRLKLGDSGPRRATEKESAEKLSQLLRIQSDADTERKINAEFIARGLPTGFVPFLTKLVQSQQRDGGSPGGDL